VDRESPRPSDAVPLADELAAVSARMAGLLMTQETVDGALDVLAALAHETVAGSSGAGVTVIDARGRRRTSGATDPVVARADALQYDLDEGPCLTAAALRQTIRVDDLAGDEGWPRWSSAVLALDLRSCLSAPMVAGERSVGAMKVYAGAPGVFDARSEHLLGMFAAQAAVLVSHVQISEQARRTSSDLRAAFRDRDVVSMARGVLIGREGVTEDAALRILMSRSIEQQVPVFDAARRLVASAVRRRR
jgi:GAF domain-containing protein